MQFNMFEAGAASTPPKKPVNPSVGYPSNGDLSHGKAPTQLGAYWVYQLSEEFTALLKDNGIEPSADDLHQLSKFFKSYKSAMSEIKAVAVEAGSGAKSVLADMRQTQKEMIALKAGTADDLRQTRDDLASTRNALSEVNSVLSDARTYTQKFNQYQSDLDSRKGQIQSLLTSNTSLEGRIKNDLSEIAKKQAAISAMESHVVQVKGQVDDINSSLTSKASDVARTLSSVNATERQMQTQLSQANAAVEAVQGVKKEVEALNGEAIGTVESVRALGKTATDAVQEGLSSVRSMVDGVGRDKSETKSYRDQAQSAAQKASASAELAKNVQWADVRNKPTTFTPGKHSHAEEDLASALGVSGAYRFIPTIDNRGALAGYEVADARKAVSSITIAKDSKDTTVLTGLTGSVSVTFKPAGVADCAVKILYLKASGTSTLTVRGARWSGGEPPSWGGAGSILILVCNFIGGEVVLTVSDIKEN